jgi:general secretion pathway protein K
MARPRTGERGAALLFVLVAVAVLTALAVDLAYQARLSLRIAANARDELRATAAAQGGIALSRAVLSLQQQIDDAMKPVAPPGGKQQPAVPAFPRPQLWRLVPVGDALAAGLFGGAAPAAAAEEGAPAPRGEGFDVAIDDEARKVNVQLEAFGTNPLLAAQVQGLYQLVCDPRWDALFDREDANGVRVSRQDLLVYLRDWVDPDEQTSGLAAAFPQGTCAVLTAAGRDPFEPGFGDENFPYDRGEDRYRAKNARMDSLAELHLVAGVSDAFMAAFSDAVTVYLRRDEKPNVNEMDPERLVLLARRIADPPDQAALLTPEFRNDLATQVAALTYGGFLSITPVAFGDIVRSLNVTVRQGFENDFTDRSTAFHLRAAGRAGDVAKTIDAVVWMTDPTNLPVTTPGRVVHWREE